LNVWLDQGPTAADALLVSYRRLVPDSFPSYHPYWDLDEALGNHGTEDPPGNPRRYEAFIAAAVSKL
jgi:hypothetical protein